MPPSIPTTEPVSLVAGDSWRWDKSLADYPPADGWALKYALRGASSLDITATAAGDHYEVRVAAAATAPLAAGTYRVAGYVEKGTDRYTVVEGVLTVAANLATITDGRTHAEKTLAVLEAAIEGRLTADLESYQINGRAVNKIPMEQLAKLRGRYRSLVWRERHPGKLGQSVEVTFGPVG